MSTEQILKEKSEYKYGFSTSIESEAFPKGLTEETVRRISQKKKKNLISYWNFVCAHLKNGN